MTPALHSCGWECAYALLDRYPERLSVQQRVLCLAAVFSAPERAREPGVVIALYVQIAVIEAEHPGVV